MRVIAVSVVEHASLSKHPVDLIHLIAAMQRVDIGLGGKQQLPGSVWVFAEDCLASNDHDLLIAGDIRRGSNDVL